MPSSPKSPLKLFHIISRLNEFFNDFSCISGVGRAEPPSGAAFKLREWVLKVKVRSGSRHECAQIMTRCMQMSLPYSAGWNRPLIGSLSDALIGRWLSFVFVAAMAFFEHVNLLYGAVSEFCTPTTCPDMSGPCQRSVDWASFAYCQICIIVLFRQYTWIDDRGKKIRLSAPQYIDYVMTYAQRTVNDETIFPTKFAHDFPPTFEQTLRKIQRLLFHVVAHLYHQVRTVRFLRRTIGIWLKRVDSFSFIFDSIFVSCCCWAYTDTCTACSRTWYYSTAGSALSRTRRRRYCAI